MNLFYPIEIFASYLSFSVFNLKKDSVLGEAVNFFIYDSIKILLLLLSIIFIISFIRSYLPREKVKKLLSTKFKGFGNLAAALFGTITPFCTCSAVPLFIGFLESGVPLGVTFSYLISAPMVNEVAAILLLGLFGWKIALIYVLSGVIIATVVGFILGKMKLEHLVEEEVWNITVGKRKQEKFDFKKRLLFAKDATLDIVKKVYIYVLLGVALGAFIHGYAPENFLGNLSNKLDIFAVPIAVLIGVPLYSNAAGIIPIVGSLIEKGLPIGTALAFMMAVTALSLPEAIILRKVLKPKLLAIYFGIVALGIIFTGYLFNFIL